MTSDPIGLDLISQILNSIRSDLITLMSDPMTPDLILILSDPIGYNVRSDYCEYIRYYDIDTTMQINNLQIGKQ